MSWQALIDLITEEAGHDIAQLIEKRARKEMGGKRITISKRVKMTVEILDEIAPGKPKQAASILGVHHSTVYRAIKRNRLIR